MAIDRVNTRIPETVIQAMADKMAPERVNGGFNPVAEDRFTKLLAMRMNGKPVDLRTTGDTPLNRVLDRLSLGSVDDLSRPVTRSRGSFSL